MLVNWWKWSLEPLGGCRQYRYDLNKLISFLPRLKQKRNDISDALTESDLRFAYQCQLVEDQTLNFQFAAALEICRTLISLIDEKELFDELV